MRFLANLFSLGLEALGRFLAPLPIRFRIDIIIITPVSSGMDCVSHPLKTTAFIYLDVYAVCFKFEPDDFHHDALGLWFVKPAIGIAEAEWPFTTTALRSLVSGQSSFRVTV